MFLCKVRLRLFVVQNLKTISFTGAKPADSGNNKVVTFCQVRNEKGKLWQN